MNTTRIEAADKISLSLSSLTENIYNITTEEEKPRVSKRYLTALRCKVLAGQQHPRESLSS